MSTREKIILPEAKLAHGPLCMYDITHIPVHGSHVKRC